VSGSVATTLPIEPSVPVSATTSGYRLGENWPAAKRSTLTKVSASPSPSTARASNAAG
jgi:hypothetical protein